MQSLDMFFPRDFFSVHFQQMVKIPESQATGKAFSPHVVELAPLNKETVITKKKNEWEEETCIAPMPLDWLLEAKSTTASALFSQKKQEKEDFSFHTIPNSDQTPPSSEIQKKRTKKLIQKEDDLWKVLSVQKPSQSQFFRSVRDILS